ncbi:MAG: DrmE family protein [Candidatus Poribacteria bacterium]|nr:DrmE family protein [Candidatus Poribacteria bacterium]
MSGWADVLSDIEHRHPFLTKLHVCGTENYSSPLPAVIQTSIDIADGLLAEETDFKRLAMTFPLLLDCPEWIAVGCSLAAIKRDFQPAIENLAPFSPGQKLLLDGKYVVEYIKEETLHGTQLLWMKTSAKSKAGQRSPDTKKGFRIGQRLRFQPVDSKRKLTPVENIASPSDHILDQLLGISSFGNRSIFKNKVVLVSRLTRVRQFAEKTYIVSHTPQGQSVPLRDLFQWGGITIEGELGQWGTKQVDAEPVLAIAPDLFALRQYLSSSNCQSSDVLIILDSSLPFANDLQILDEVLDEGYSVFAIMENRSLNDLKHLEDRNFRSWEWSGSELEQFESIESIDSSNLQIPFRHFHRIVQNYSARQIEEVICNCPDLDSAADKLQTFSKQCYSDDPELRIIEGKFYHCLLNLSRLLRPLGLVAGIDKDKSLKELLEQIQPYVQSKEIWLGRDAVALAHEFIKEIKTLIENQNCILDKITILEEILQNNTQGNQSAIVLTDASEVPITESYWQAILPNSLNQDEICFVSPSGFNLDKGFDHLVVCGWLGADRMLELFDSCIAPSITVLLYPFEQKWFRSVVRRWHKQKKPELTVQQKAKILQTQTEALLFTQGSKERKLLTADSESDFDVADFELRLHTYRYAQPSISGEMRKKARFIAFSQDMFAYLLPNHKVPVVTDFIAGYADESAEIPSRNASQLRVGDYVIFSEGSDSDLLRDLADKGLAKAGKGGYREIASLWKQALRQFVFVHPDYFEGALIELWDEGLKCTETTVRRWLNDEHLIGPRNEQDIEIIARVSSDQELQKQLDYVRRAIKEVRGAHQQAAYFLAQKLIAQLPSLLKQGLSKSHTIEIEDIGQALVICIEYIGEEDIEVPVTKVNRLLKDEF